MITVRSDAELAAMISSVRKLLLVKFEKFCNKISSWKSRGRIIRPSLEICNRNFLRACAHGVSVCQMIFFVTSTFQLGTTLH